MKNKESVRTKINKSERVELRCTKAFKESLNEIATQNGLTISALIESICTDKIKEYYGKSAVQIPPKKKEVKKPVSTPESKPKNTKGDARRIECEKEIWRMLEEGRTPTESAKWLNENGYRPQRGDAFTMNSVHSIRRRLKREKAL